VTETALDIVALTEALFTSLRNALDFSFSSWARYEQKTSRGDFYLTKIRKTGLYTVPFHGAALFVCTIAPAITWPSEWPGAPLKVSHRTSKGNIFINLYGLWEIN
jgi:hypothetical protein